MKIAVNGVELFFDVVGSALVPEGPRMRKRPTLLLLHGGPGADHTLYRPAMDALADVAQLVYYDHRANGRSGDGPRERWTLAQWADDVRGLCDALGIDRPIVYGASFGGMVALAYAQRHPGHALGLILHATAARGGAFTAERVAKFRQLGGAVAGELAERRLIHGDTSHDVLAAWLVHCLPCYALTPPPPESLARMINRADVTQWFSRTEGEGNRFDLRPGLAGIECPVLLMGGTDDPMLPIENQREIAAGLANAELDYEEITGARHMLVADAPERVLGAMRRFITRLTEPRAEP